MGEMIWFGSVRFFAELFLSSSTTTYTRSFPSRLFSSFVRRKSIIPFTTPAYTHPHFHIYRSFFRHDALYLLSSSSIHLDKRPFAGSAMRPKFFFAEPPPIIPRLYPLLSLVRNIAFPSPPTPLQLISTTPAALTALNTLPSVSHRYDTDMALFLSTSLASLDPLLFLISIYIIKT